MQKNSLIDKLKKRKEMQQDISRLLESKEYDKVFERYGPEVYRKTIPPKVKRAEIQELLKQGRYEDIRRRYGEKTYKYYLVNMTKVDVEMETGSKVKGNIEQIKYWFKIKFAPILLSLELLATPPIIVKAIDDGYTKNTNNNAIEYSEEIKEYNEHIEKYAEEIRNLNLTDRQIFVKLIYDLWREIDGYKTPKKYDVSRYYRLSVYEEHIGQCRHFSDHIAAILNAINKKYNARSLYVRVKPNEYHYMDIERRMLETDNNNNNGFRSPLIEDILRKPCSNCG